jgi:UDP-glucose 4-epimerase
MVLDSRAPEGSSADPGVEHRVVDVTELASLREALPGVDFLFHLAANANGTYSVEHPRQDFQTNCLGTFNVLQAALASGVRRVLYVSSASVYGRPRRFPVEESHPTDPILPYGASKLAGERFGVAFWHAYGLDVVVARPFCVYGPGEDPATSLVEVSRYLRWHLNGRPIQVVGDPGRKTRDFVHVLDAVAALLVIAEGAGPGEVLNVGSGTEVSMGELVRAIQRAAGGTARVRGLEGIQEDTYRLVADISKLRRLGYAPQVSLDHGIEDLIEELGDRPELPAGATIFRPGQQAEE